VEDGHAATSWAFSAYGAKGAKVAVDRPIVSAPGGALALSRADRFKQEDTLKAAWNGRGKASLVLSGNDANFSHQLKENMAISLSLRVDAAPTGKVLFGMGAAAKLGHVDLTAALARAKAKGWVNLQVRLSCLAKAGANMGAISVPLEMVTDGKLSVSLYSARLDAMSDAGSCIGVAAQ
ncbi:MAG: putative glycoside hydrolase, partial [Rhizomicrobium sp.]